MKRIDAIKQTLVKQGFSQPVKDYEENYLMLVRRWDIFYEPDELVYIFAHYLWFITCMKEIKVWPCAEIYSNVKSIYGHENQFP